MIIWIIVLATITTLFGIGYLRGKCDGFIAGYNTSSPEKQKRYDIKRLRLIVACFHFAIAGLLFLFLMKSDLAAEAMPECGGLVVGVRKMIIFAW